MTDIRTRPEQIKYQLDILSNYTMNARFTEWEAEFITSLKDQFRRKGDLSVKQMNRLEEIYIKYT